MIKKFFILFVSVNLIAESIVVDGNLDEPEWQTAFKITEFYESDPYTLRKTDDETEAYIFSNEDGIYVGFINYQDESTMLSNRTMRDEMSSLSEKNSINIDFDGDRTKAYIIAVALGDSLFDAIKIQSGDFKTDWDGDWIAKTKQFKTYWTSEFYLPWNVVLMNQSDANKRRINYSALRYKASEQSWYSSAGTMAMRADYFQELDSLEINNFTRSKLNFFPYFAFNKNTPQNFQESNIGAELFYNSGKGSQINLTVNPDFGQAESDDVIVNFSAQETFYKEKRAFFTENQSLFDISNYERYSIINTRRIGAAPSYNCSEELNEEDCINTRKNYSDIDFSLRFTQKNGQNNYGIFLAKESDEDFSKGREFIALRGKTKINSKTLGYMVTNVENDFLGTKSTVNVFDYINVRSEKLTTYADILTTKKEGDSGKGLRLQYTYKPTELTRNSASILYFDKEVRLNDFGYLKRNDWFHFGMGQNIKKVDFDNNSPFQQIETNYDFNYDADTDGNSNPIDFTQRNSITFTDTSKFNYDFRFNTSGKNTTITRKDPLYPFVKIKKNFSVTADFEEKNFKYWTYDWRISFDKSSKYDDWDSNGYQKRFFKIAGSLFPNENIKIRSEFRVKKEKEWLNWIDGNHLAAYDLNQRILSLNLNWFKGTKHEIRLKSQFIALEAKNPVSLETNSNGVLFGSEKLVNPFSNGITSFQVRYRYEIAPLSNVYIVYTKGGNVYEEDDERSFSDIFRDPWENPENEIFSIKVRLKF
tara:strand:+ start:5100 stop:7376 length:2277 start_codon:yes stop_codon:yes gene_type:complete